MPKENHYICKVQDRKDNYKEISSAWTDQTTALKAKKVFLDKPAIKPYVGLADYQIVFHIQKSFIIQ